MCGLAVGIVSAPAATAEAQEPDDGARRRGGADLKRCLDLADRNHPDLMASRSQLAHVEAQLLEVFTEHIGAH